MGIPDLCKGCARNFIFKEGRCWYFWERKKICSMFEAGIPQEEAKEEKDE